ncbi:MAG: hypothetical protein JOZ24_09100 [Candidatus Eremiobacteraeota bacterium]|nr:hypothetical protein [Candidatus Eremiobacteraeota bacterium]
MNPQNPVIPDPSPPQQDPVAPVDDPAVEGQPDEYAAASQSRAPSSGAVDDYGKLSADDDELDDYDKADADSFPASDPPAATEPTR